MSVGNNITMLRKKAKMTQEQLAEKCNVSRQAVAKWETGESEPTIERLIMLSDVFQITIDELIKDNENQIRVEKLIDNDVNERVFHDVQRTICNLSAIWDFRMESQKGNVADLQYCMWNLYWIMSHKYVDADRKIYDKYLLSNTTKNEREQYTKALIGEFDFLTQSIGDYVNGKIEIDAAFELIFAEIDRQQEITNNKQENALKKEIGL